MPETGEVLEIGKGARLAGGSWTWRSCPSGAHLAEAREAVKDLEAKGRCRSRLPIARFAKPLRPRGLIDDLMANHRALITVEQGAMLGFGGLVLHHLAATAQLDGRWRGGARCTCPTASSTRRARRRMYAEAGLTSADIAGRRVAGDGHRDDPRAAQGQRLNRHDPAKGKRRSDRGAVSRFGWEVGSGGHTAEDRSARDPADRSAATA